MSCPWQGPRGTTISFTFDAIRDGHLDRAVKAAALHFPLPVTYNDEPLPRVDFLTGAHAVIEREGYRIGVYKDVNLDHVPTINFHGLTLRHKLPSIKEVYHTLWRVKVDIIDAPELVLVLPARKEIYHNPALDRLMEICNEAIFAAISQGTVPSPRPQGLAGRETCRLRATRSSKAITLLARTLRARQLP